MKTNNNRRTTLFSQGIISKALEKVPRLSPQNAMKLPTSILERIPPSLLPIPASTISTRRIPKAVQPDSPVAISETFRIDPEIIPENCSDSDVTQAIVDYNEKIEQIARHNHEISRETLQGSIAIAQMEPDQVQEIMEYHRLAIVELFEEADSTLQKALDKVENTTKNNPQIDLSELNGRIGRFKTSVVTMTQKMKMGNNYEQYIKEMQHWSEELQNFRVISIEAESIGRSYRVTRRLSNNAKDQKLLAQEVQHKLAERAISILHKKKALDSMSTGSNLRVQQYTSGVQNRTMNVINSQSVKISRKAAPNSTSTTTRNTKKIYNRMQELTVLEAKLDKNSRKVRQRASTLVIIPSLTGEEMRDDLSSVLEADSSNSSNYRDYISNELVLMTKELKLETDEIPKFREVTAPLARSVAAQVYYKNTEFVEDIKSIQKKPRYQIRPPLHTKIIPRRFVNGIGRVVYDFQRLAFGSNVKPNGLIMDPNTELDIIVGGRVDELADEILNDWEVKMGSAVMARKKEEYLQQQRQQTIELVRNTLTPTHIAGALPPARETIDVAPIDLSVFQEVIIPTSEQPEILTTDLAIDHQGTDELTYELLFDVDQPDLPTEIPSVIEHPRTEKHLSTDNTNDDDKYSPPPIMW